MTSTEVFLAKRVTGGSFLIEDAQPGDIFTPEDFSDEQKQIATTTEAFAEERILSQISEIEAKNFAVSRGLMKEAGDLGLLSVDVPEEYGGLEMDKITSAIIADKIAVCGSFSVTFAAHTGIGMLPLIWYGTPEQKARYLPRLASGEWIASYALSEASAGSDAMNIRAQAKLSEDGSHYILNGEKMWISNAGFADLFTVFAKIDGEKFTAFLIEAGTAGLTVAKEEHKLGIRGSSTCALILRDCKVPAGNLLGIAGKGHQIAFNILNVGRYKLGAIAIGGIRNALRNGIRYGRERIAFGKPITSFGLLQEMIARGATGVYVCESLIYRLVGAIDAALEGLDKHSSTYSQDVQNRIEEFAIECSIAKVWCSEMLDLVVDEMLQIHGGYGYTEEFPAELAYRDARINRIFEGTNEINRLIITGWMMKRGKQGQLPLLPAIQKVMDEVLSGTIGEPEPHGPLAHERDLLTRAKKLGLFCAGAASQKFGNELGEQQEIMGCLSDILMEIFALESAMLRAEKSQNNTAISMTKYYAARSFAIVTEAAEKLLGPVSEGDSLSTQMAIFRRLSRHEPINTIALGREISETMVAAGRYTLSL